MPLRSDEVGSSCPTISSASPPRPTNTSLPKFPNNAQLVLIETNTNLLSALLPALNKYQCLQQQQQQAAVPTSGNRRRRSPWVRAFCDLYHPAGPWGSNSFRNTPDIESRRKYSFKSYQVPTLHKQLQQYTGHSRVHLELKQALDDYYLADQWRSRFLQGCQRVADMEMNKPLAERAPIPTAETGVVVTNATTTTRDVTEYENTAKKEVVADAENVKDVAEYSGTEKEHMAEEEEVVVDVENMESAEADKERRTEGGVAEEQDELPVDPMNAANYVTVHLPKPMGIGVNGNIAAYGGLYIEFVKDNSAASGRLVVGDQLVVVQQKVVAGMPFNDALGTIVNTTTETVELTVFRGTAKQLYGPMGATQEWLEKEFGGPKKKRTAEGDFPEETASNKRFRSPRTRSETINKAARLIHTEAETESVQKSPSPRTGDLQERGETKEGKRDSVAEPTGGYVQHTASPGRQEISDTQEEEDSDQQDELKPTKVSDTALSAASPQKKSPTLAPSTVSPEAKKDKAKGCLEKKRTELEMMLSRRQNGLPKDRWTEDPICGKIQQQIDKIDEELLELILG